MKKTALFIGSLIVLTSLHAYAQAPVKRSLRSQNATATSQPTATVENRTTATSPATDGAPRVTLGTIETTTSSREKVLAYPRLLAQELGCEVKSFTFTITAGDKTWGPETVKDAVFTEEIKDKIKEWEAPKIRISITNIQVNCGGKDVTAQPIEIEYEH